MSAARESCTLDVADRDGGLTLADIAAFAGVSRERIRQIEEEALAKIRKRASSVPTKSTLAARTLVEFVEVPAPNSRERPSNQGADRWNREAVKRERDVAAADEAPVALGAVWNASARGKPADLDRLACERVWGIYLRDSRARGFEPEVDEVASKKKRGRAFNFGGSGGRKPKHRRAILDRVLGGETRPSHLARSLGLSLPTVSKYFAAFVDEKILVRRGVGGATRYQLVGDMVRREVLA